MGATCSSNSTNPNCTNPTIQLNSNPILNPIPTTNPSLTNSTAIIPNVELIKKIENFTFILLSKQKDAIYNYVIVNIEETGKIYKYYTSNSELGIWRLCLIRPEDKNNYKGTDFYINNFFVKHDYVQNTLIHLELQDFINENFDKLSLLSKNSKYMCSLIYSIVNPINDINKPIINLPENNQPNFTKIPSNITSFTPNNDKITYEYNIINGYRI